MGWGKVIARSLDDGSSISFCDLNMFLIREKCDGKVVKLCEKCSSVTPTAKMSICSGVYKT